MCEKTNKAEVSEVGSAVGAVLGAVEEDARIFDRMAEVYERDGDRKDDAKEMRSLAEQRRNEARRLRIVLGSGR